MKKQFDQVAEFHRAFLHPVALSAQALSEGRTLARAHWIRSEVDELLEAKKIEEQADAFIDIIYFALGGLVEMGIDPEGLFEIVHQANMAKLWSDGEPRFRKDGKVIKPPDWQDPAERLEMEIKRQAAAAPSSRSYEIIEALPALCVVACFLMAIKSASYIRLPDQKALGEALGYTKEGVNTIGTGIKLLDIAEHKSDLLDIYIHEIDYRLANSFQEWDFEVIADAAIRDGKHVICALSAGRLFNNTSEDLGHAVLVEKVHASSVQIVDPGPGTTGRRTVPAEDLYIASRAREGGLLTFKVRNP